MTKITYKKIILQAKTCQANVKKEYKTGMTSKWSYYFAKAILTPHKDFDKIKFTDAIEPTGSSISNQIPKKDYLDICQRLIEYVEKNKKLPNYVKYGKYQLSPQLLTEILSRILLWYLEHEYMPSKANANSRVFTKPLEDENVVYQYFKKVFGDFGDTIDGALGKVNGRGYGYYYDDKYSNKEAIDRMKKGLGVNCTDSCHVFYNILLELIKKGKYKKVECIHVKCRGGDGHVRLRITLKDGSKIYRDPACCLENNGRGATCNWCMDGSILAVDPSWFKSNLNR